MGNEPFTRLASAAWLLPCLDAALAAPFADGVLRLPREPSDLDGRVPIFHGLGVHDRIEFFSDFAQVGINLVQPRDKLISKTNCGFIRMLWPAGPDGASLGLPLGNRILPQQVCRRASNFLIRYLVLPGSLAHWIALLFAAVVFRK